jgi:ubiquinone biosynthesis protein UbiJ
MLIQSLLASGLTSAINLAFKLDGSQSSQLDALAGASLCIKLDELPWPLLMHFSEEIDLVISDDEVQADCTLALSLTLLPALQDNSQISGLIQSGKLDIQGDLEIARRAGMMFNQLDIDWEEHLSGYLGDVATYQLMRSVQSITQNLRNGGERLRQLISEGALEEKHIAAPKVAINHFVNKVNQLSADSDRFDARLTLLERQNSC